MGYVGMVFTRLDMVDDMHIAHALSHLHICLMRCLKMMKCASFKVLGKKCLVKEQFLQVNFMLLTILSEVGRVYFSGHNINIELYFFNALVFANL
jgi:hypothetical protein